MYKNTYISGKKYTFGYCKTIRFDSYILLRQDMSDKQNFSDIKKET